MDTSRLPLLRKVMEQITNHPEEHDQATWGVRRSCGTTRCVAGWAMEFGADSVVWSDDPGFVSDELGFVSTIERAVIDGIAYVPLRAGGILLGLDNDEEYDLFIHAQNIDAIWEVVERITDGELTREMVEAGR